MKFEEKRGLKVRANSDSDLLKEGKVTPANTKDPFPERKFLPFDRKVRVEEYLENLWETFSEITLPSDSGEGTWSSAASEDGFDKGDRLEKFDQVEGLIEDAIENWNSIQEAYKDASPFEGRKYHSIGKELKKSRMALGTLREMEKEWMNAGLTCFVCLVVGLLFCQTSGEYWLQMFDSFTGTLPLLFICFFELVGVSWIYGANRFYDDIEYMLRMRPGLYWKITWRFVSPLIVFVIFVWSVLNLGLKPITYSVWHSKEGDVKSVEYPYWCLFIIAVLICASCLCIPAVFFLRLYQSVISRRKRDTEIVRDLLETSAKKPPEKNTE